MSSVRKNSISPSVCRASSQKWQNVSGFIVLRELMYSNTAADHHLVLMKLNPTFDLAFVCARKLCHLWTLSVVHTNNTQIIPVCHHTIDARHQTCSCVCTSLSHIRCAWSISPAGFRFLFPTVTSTAVLTRMPMVSFSGFSMDSSLAGQQNKTKQKKQLLKTIKS